MEMIKIYFWLNNEFDGNFAQISDIYIKSGFKLVKYTDLFSVKVVSLGL